MRSTKLLLSLLLLGGAELRAQSQLPPLTTVAGSPRLPGKVVCYDPWYYGGYWDDPDYIVTPPPSGERPPGGVGAHPEQPIAKPPPVTSAPRPTPMPSIPSAPRPMARPALRR